MIYCRETHVSSLIQFGSWYIIYGQFNKCHCCVTWRKVEPLGDDNKKGERER